jgi:tetratricopeptide (TPR) repeat protein
MNYLKHPRAFLVPCLIAATTALAFLPVLRNSFVGWDDHVVLLSNPDYRGLGLTQLSWMFTSLMSLYRPLTWMTFGADYLLWGLNPSGYHLTSLLFHSANAVLVYFIAARLLSLAASGDDTMRIRFAAAFSALLFALHPLRVEPVAWASGRENVVAGFFIFLSLLFYLRAVEWNSGRKWLIAAYTAYALSLLSKASGMTFPFVLLALDFYPLRRFSRATGKWFSADDARVWLEKIPFFLLGVAAAVLSIIAKHEGGALADSNVWANLPRAVYAIGVYLWKTIFPVNLSPIYPVPDSGEIWGSPLIIFPAIVIAVTTAVIILRRRYPAVATAGFCYIALLLPSSGIVKYGPQLVADRYTYLPDVVLAICAGGAALLIWRRMPRQLLLPASIAAMAVLFSLGVLTWRQAHIWRDSESLFRRAVAVAPRSVIAHHNLASVLVGEGRHEEAAAEYRRALAIRDYPDGHTALADLFSRQNKFDEAIRHDREAIRLDASQMLPRQHLALILIRQQRFDEALVEYAEALKTDPTFVEGHNNLGLLLARRGRIEDAIAHYRRAIALQPDFALAYANLGDALLIQGKTDEAVAQLQKALEIDPHLTSARQNLDNALSAQQRRN